ncbi:MAG: hypothetical protein ACRC4M_05380 [Mycoplasma sp.]
MEFLDVMLIIASFISSIFVFLLGKKLYYRYKLKKRFFIIPRVSSRGISNIGMVLALSIAIILFLIIITANFASMVFRVWGGTRIILEGILIKIGGLLFGPIIGMALGAAVDLLTITYSGGLFHFGYFLSAILFGLMGGFIRMLISSSKNKDLRFVIYSSISTLIVIGISLLPIILNQKEIYSFSLFNVEIKMTRNIILALLVAVPSLGIGLMWLCYWIQLNQIKKNPLAKRWFKNFAPVFITILITEVVINILIMPYFDAQVSTLGYEAWFAIRLSLLIPMVVLNSVIIIPVFTIVNPIVTYRYDDELVEDLDQPLFIE